MKHNKILISKKILVVGASTIETTYKLLDGTSHEEDTVLTAREMEHTFGGAGICNALALSQTHITKTLSLLTVAGKNGDKLDHDAKKLVSFLKKEKINPVLQLHKGHTEKTVMFLSGASKDLKRGFRLASSEGSILRNYFSIDNQTVKALKEAQVVVACSFPTETVVKLAEKYKKIKPQDSLFIWTINKDSANGIMKDPRAQQILKKGTIDIICMSDKDITAVMQKDFDNPFQGVPLQVITQGSRGCTIVDTFENKKNVYQIPAFKIAENTLNDNGAGEAHHTNFIAMYLYSKELFGYNQSPIMRRRIIAVAASFANLAAYLKITQPHSLWFPQLSFISVKKLLTDTSIAEESITKFIYDLYTRTRPSWQATDLEKKTITI